jgi:hypothetical protein
MVLMPSCERAPTSGSGGQAWQGDHAGGDHGGGGSREGGQGRAAASTWPLALELENDDLAMDRRVGVVGRVLHVLATSQGLKGAE